MKAKPAPRLNEGARRLGSWLKAHGFTQTGLANELGLERQSVHRYLNGWRPEPEIMHAIEQLTRGRGQVRMQHWMVEARQRHAA